MKVKDYNKKILFFLMCIFMALWFACTNNKSGSSLSSGTNSETGYIKFNVSSSVLQSKLNIVRSVLRSTVSKTDAAKLIVSIEDDSGNNIYVDKELTLYTIGDDFISAPLSLEVGKNYSLTKFLVADKDNNIIFATPLKDSAQAKLVTNPLPIALNNITKDTVVKTTPEVTAIDNSTAKDFGYASFDFTIVDTFKVLLSVQIYNNTDKNWELTTSDYEFLSSDNKTLNSGSLEAKTNSIYLPQNGYSEYDLKISKTGYETYQNTFSLTEIKNYTNEPLIVLLNSNPSEPIINKRIGAGAKHTCIILTNNTVKCWGFNWNGQVGNLSGNNVDIPVYVVGYINAKQLALGAYHTCALFNDETVKCWGNKEYGQIGDGDDVFNAYIPVKVPNLTNVKQIAAGYHHTCVVLNDGTVKCWGKGDYGQIGDGYTDNVLTPIILQNLTNVKQIALGNYHTCALLNDETVKCWGNGENGQLGNNKYGENYKELRPIIVPNLTNVKQIALGGNNTCALLKDETVKCWGAGNVGQIGDGNTSDKYSPVLVSNLTNVKQIDVGGSHTCAILKDETIKCWGWGYYGKLGNRSWADEIIPFAVPNLTNVQEIALGDVHTCVFLNDETMKCWGYGGEGQLGIGKPVYFFDRPATNVAL